MTNSYDEVYKWFELLDEQRNYITGFVIMPNHLHFIMYLNEKEKSLNKVIGNGKRFLSYELVKRLKNMNDFKTLSVLQQQVTPSDRLRGKQHQPFKHSFDAKRIISIEMMNEKLRYMHHNPVSKKWNLVKDYIDYPHSSAMFYENGESRFTWLKRYYEIIDGKYT